MSDKCPYCGGPLTGAAALPVMSHRKINIYNAVAQAGSTGIPSNDLVNKMFSDWPEVPPSGYGMLRTSICELNKIIAPLNQRIVGRRMVGYRLTTTNGDSYGETAEEATGEADNSDSIPHTDAQQPSVDGIVDAGDTGQATQGKATHKKNRRER